MKLRHKKTHNLSQDNFYPDFQNQHFQTHNRKPELNKRFIYHSYKTNHITQSDKSSYAQILVKFINNINLAKHQQQIKRKIRHPHRNILRQQNSKPKRFRKTSQNISFDQQKKVEYLKPAFNDSHFSTSKNKNQSKSSKLLNAFSINKLPTNYLISQNKANQFSQQNIINNCYSQGSFNFNDYARFLQSPYFALNNQIINNLVQINPFFNSNWSSLSPLAQSMKNGLYRQLQIYQRFGPQSNPSIIQNKSFSQSAPSHNQPQKIQKHEPPIEPQKKLNPDKIFKRASYHVGIAYSIYMDNIQKEGKKIKSYQEIDPTRFAKKYKSSLKKE